MTIKVDDKVETYKTLGYEVRKRMLGAVALTKPVGNSFAGILVTDDGGSVVMKSHEVERLITNPEEYDYMATKKKVAESKKAAAPKKAVAPKKAAATEKPVKKTSVSGLFKIALDDGLTKEEALEFVRGKCPGRNIPDVYYAWYKRDFEKRALDI